MRKSSYIALLLVVFMMMANTVKAQWHKWQFGGGVGSLTYHGDLSDRFVNANLQELGYHAFVERIISKKSGIYWRLETVNGHLLGSDRAPGGWINGTSPNFDRSLNFRTNIHDVNTALVFYFGNNRKRETPPFLNTYIKAGIGVGFFDVRGDLLDENGNFYNYWSDRTLRDIPQNASNASDAQVIKRDYNYETDLLAYEVETEYNRFKWQIPLALGLKMKLGNAVSLNLEAQYTYAMTDYLDNVGDEKVRTNSSIPYFNQIADPAGFIGDRPRNLDKPTGVNDGYLYVSAGLSFNVGKHTKPKSKTPKFYPKYITPTLKDEVETDSLQMDTSTTITHPFDSLYQSSQQTYLKDTIDYKKDSISEPTTVFSKQLDNSNDSLFVELFQTNHKLWLTNDSSISDKKIDSVIITKIPDVEKRYVVQYVENVIVNGDTSQIFLRDTIILNTEKRSITRDSIVYSTGETYYRIGNLEELIETDTFKKSSADTNSIKVNDLRSQLNDLEKKYQEDTVKYSTKSSDIQYEYDTLSLSPANYKMLVQNTDTVQVDSNQLKRAEIDSLFKKEQKLLNVKIDSLELIKSNALDTSTSKIIIPEDTAIVSKVDSVAINNKRLDDLKAKIKELEKTEIKRDSTLKADSLFIESNSKVNNSTPLIVKDTIVEKYKADSISMSKKVEELKLQLKNLENKEKNDTIKTSNVQVKKDTVSTSKLKVNNTDTVKVNDEVEILRNRIKELESKNDTLQTQAASSAKIFSTEKVASEPEDIDSIDTQNEELKKRIASIENQIQQQRVKSDSIQKLSQSVPNTQQNKWEEKEIVVVQNDLEKRIADLESQLKEEQSKNTRRISSSEKLDQQYKVDSLTQALNYYKYSSDILRRDGYIPNYSNQRQSGFQPVIEPVITIPIGGGSRRERRQQAKYEASLAQEGQTTSEKETQKTQIGFNHDGKPGFIESKRSKNEVDSTSKDTLSVENDSVDSTNIIPDSALQDTLTVSDTSRSSVVTNEASSNLEAENVWLKSQISDIQKSQDSLLGILQELLLKSNQAPAAPVVVEKEVVKEVKTEVDPNILLDGILSQPSSKVFFAVGKSALTSQFKPSLDQLAQQLKKYPELKIELKGFADPTGNAAANMQLSEKRAQSVKNYLSQIHQINADRIIVLPVGQEDNSSDLSYSRRVEVKLVR